MTLSYLTLRVAQSPKHKDPLEDVDDIYTQQSTLPNFA